MYENCDPYIFYWKVRPYLAGWQNEDRLPDGLIYEGVDGNDELGNPIHRKYIGGSAGQSALIQALDTVLQIEHHSTGFIKPSVNKSKEVDVNEVIEVNGVNGFNKNGEVGKDNGISNGVGRRCPMGNEYNKAPQVNCCNMSDDKSKPYLYKIRENMPGLHRRFLEDLAKTANIRDYIISNIGYGSRNDDEEIDNLIRAYNECLTQMKNFRSIHLQIVSVYIVIQKNRDRGALPFNKGIRLIHASTF